MYLLVPYLLIKDNRTASAATLVEAGALSGAQDGNRTTPLMQACAHGRVGIVQLLLEASPHDLEAMDAYLMMTPLHFVAQFTLARFNPKNYEGNEHDSEQVALLLLDAGADPNHLHPEDNGSPLLFACAKGNLGAARALLRAGADLNLAEHSRGYTPLLVASEQGHTAVMQLLLLHGCNPNVTTDGGATALMLASKSERPEAIELLISWSIDIEATDLQGFSALQYALVRNVPFRHLHTPGDAASDDDNEDKEVSEKTLHCIRLLLTAGANPERTDARYEAGPALTLATIRGQPSLVELLLAHGAVPDAKAGPDGEVTALTMATLLGKTEIAEMLLRAGAHPAYDISVLDPTFDKPNRRGA